MTTIAHDKDEPRHNIFLFSINFITFGYLVKGITNFISWKRNAL